MYLPLKIKIKINVMLHVATVLGILNEVLKP